MLVDKGFRLIALLFRRIVRAIAEISSLQHVPIDLIQTRKIRIELRGYKVSMSICEQERNLVGLQRRSDETMMTISSLLRCRIPPHPVLMFNNMEKTA